MTVAYVFYFCEEVDTKYLARLQRWRKYIPETLEVSEEWDLAVSKGSKLRCKFALR